MKLRSGLIYVAILLLGATVGPTVLAETVRDELFDRAMIHFNPDSADAYASDGITVSDNGRAIHRRVTLPQINGPTKITGLLELIPIPKDPLSVYDSWDRAGNIRLSAVNLPDIELIKFVTAYGGRTSYEVDLSHLASLLTGEVTITGFIDNWVSPGWRVNFSLTYEPDESVKQPVWIHPLAFVESFNQADHSGSGVNVTITIPADLKRVQLYYLVSGHCTDGRDADEFISKDNVIAIDGEVVYRYQPWRDDCRQFRSINPYTKHWSDGSWSSDYSRSGWCPGDLVEPLVLDLSDHLTVGDHSVSIRIEDIRPTDEDGNFGYWRVSAYLVGWATKDNYRYNE